ncbi:MAG TPA: hypothetical protein VD932_07005 [Aquabacterium sp.]|nr:hypothetical protein [Aquabacterium sp.]
MGLAVAAVTALGLTAGGAVADVVALPGDGLDPAAASASTDVLSDSAGAADPFAELLSVGTSEAEAHTPLLELLGVPQQPVRRGRPADYVAAASVDHPSMAKTRDLHRFATSAPDEADDGVATLGRQAFEMLQGFGESAGETGPVAVNRSTAARETLSSSAGARPAEAQSTWLREGLLLLRSNREWVLAGVIALLGAMVALRHFARPNAAAGPRRHRSRSQLAR